MASNWTGLSKEKKGAYAARSRAATKNRRVRAKRTAESNKSKSFLSGAKTNAATGRAARA